MLKVSATKRGLVLDEPNVVGMIDGQAVTPEPLTLSDVKARFSRWITDWTDLELLGLQSMTMPASGKILTFKRV